MKNMSNADEILARLFADEQLPPPAVLHWPLDGPAEEDRLVREERFRAGPGTHPPDGMPWLARHARTKYRPNEILPDCRSILVTWLSYFRDDLSDPSPMRDRRRTKDQSFATGISADSSGNGPAGRVARYARGRDYHKELGGRLRRIRRALEAAFPEEAFRSFTDIGPLDETWLAEASGLGFKGRHSLAILPGVGSWVVLGHIVTSLEMEARPGRPSPLACPEGCTRCIDACPTDALIPGRGVNSEACISYLTIETSGSLDPALRSAVGDALFGCDICQEVCPFNARVRPTEVPAFLADIAGPSQPLRDILVLKHHDDVTGRFAGSPLMRAGRSGLVRNACTVAGNSGDRSLRPLLEALIEDEDSGVREHARWALERLNGSD